MIGDIDLKVAKAVRHAAGRRRRNVRRPHRRRQRHRPQRLRDRPRQEDQAGAVVSDEHRPQLRRSAARARFDAAHREAQGRHAGELEGRRRRDHPPVRVTDDEAKQKYPEGWKAPKPYLRIVPQPK